MTSPIENKVGGVFIPVSDMKKSIEWYSKLLNLPIKDTSHEGRIYDLSMAGGVGLILDGHKQVSNSSQPLCFFWTKDIQQAYKFLKENNIEIVSEPEDIGSVSTLIFKDPDSNLLMACQSNLS